MNTCFFILFHLILVLSVFEILDKNATAFNAFVTGWQFFVKNPILCLLVSLWILFLSVFSMLTLFIGSIWAVPAQYNAMALLYERVRQC